MRVLYFLFQLSFKLSLHLNKLKISYSTYFASLISTNFESTIYICNHLLDDLDGLIESSVFFFLFKVTFWSFK